MSEEVYREGLIEATKLTNNHLHAFIVYGSHVAGYARPESDYDFLAVVKDFKEKIRYNYLDLPSGLEASILLVDKETFEKDMERAFLGEFVAGRLYGSYIPLLNKDYILEYEKILKMRTIIEELIDLYSEFESFLPNLMVPLEYFLYSKLKKRMAIYPPVKYSYTKTFFGPSGEANTEFSLRLFRVAAQELSQKGILELVEDKVRIIDPQVTRARIEDFLHHLHQIYRGVKSYLVHAWAGKVGPRIVVNEFRSKISRAFRKYEVPEPLKKPYLLLKLSDADVGFFYESDLEKTIEDTLGSECEIVEKEKVSGFLSTLYRLRVEVKEEKGIYVYKNYSDVGRLKWFPVELWALTAAEFSAAPKTRLSNEYLYLTKLRKLGFNVPKVLAVMWDEKSLLMEYVEGTTLSNLISNKVSDIDLEGVAARVGELLSLLHSHQICLGDAKAQNILVTDEGVIYFTDLEQANQQGNYAWDISLFLFYSARFPTEKGKILRTAESFIKGYGRHGDPAKVAEASSAKYVRIFAPMVLPDTLKSIIDLCREDRTK
ncbi:MAG: hypothetical protein GTN80_05260 [Nitrososphaeria archaeon]|nr:hypothetical protein [Nitrososphaeria archaeon]NIQ33034.1 hypothetical protein [Nitrososphaeria archaeon]